MEYPIRIWSKAYAPSPDTDSFSIQVDKTIWRQAMQQEGSRRKFVRILHPEGMEDWIAPLGQPVTVSDEEEDIYNIYMPLWMLDAAQLQGEGEQAVVEVLDEEHFPEATRIVFRVVDSAIYNADIKDELERSLSALGVIRQHSTLQIPVSALGGYVVEVFVSKTEPATIVLCDGEEVAVEFEEPVDQIAPPRPPTPVPESPPPLVPPVSSESFSAFSGQGHTLGGSNVDVPEWRRGIPPPPRR